MTDLFNEIHQAGLKISMHGDQLKVEGSLTERLRNLIRNNKQTLIKHLAKSHDAQANELQQNIRESIEERSAILEHDAGLPKVEAERQAVNSMKVYRYRHAEKPDSDLICILPGCDLAEAETSLKRRFGDKFISVLNEYSRWRVAELADQAKITLSPRP